MKRLILFLLVLLLCSPVGAADYYVSTDGTNSTTCPSNDPCGPATIPWTTVDNETSTVYLFGGNYPTDDDFSITHNTTANLLTIRPCSYAGASCPEGKNGVVNFARAGAPGYNNITVIGSNVVIDGRTTAASTTPCDDGATSSCNIKITLGDTMGIELASTASTGNVIKWVELTGMGSTTGSRYGINAPGVGTGTEISYNYFHDNDGHSDIVAYAAAASMDYGVVSIHHNITRRGTANYVSGGRGGIDAYNNIFDVSEAAAPYDVFHFYENAGTTGIGYIRIYNNYFDQSDQMIFLENATTDDCTGAPCPTQHIRVFNNVFTCTAPETITEVFFGGRPILIENADAAGGTVDDFFIVNNTFVNTQYGVALTGPSSGSVTYTNFKVVNNIFYDGSTDAGYENNVAVGYGNNVTWANEADAIFNNNIIYDNDGFRTSWSITGTWTTYTALATFETDHATYTDNDTSDPVFAETTNYTINASSSTAAKTGGLDASEYSNMPTGWPFDKAGTTRTAPFSIGAYGYAEEAATGNVRGLSISGGSIQ